MTFELRAIQRAKADVTDSDSLPARYNLWLWVLIFYAETCINFSISELGSLVAMTKLLDSILKEKASQMS